VKHSSDNIVIRIQRQTQCDGLNLTFYMRLCSNKSQGDVPLTINFYDS